MKRVRNSPARVPPMTAFAAYMIRHRGRWSTTGRTQAQHLRRPAVKTRRPANVRIVPPHEKRQQTERRNAAARVVARIFSRRKV